MGDAIVRTLVRVYVTRRQLLEWVTAAQAQGRPRPEPAGLLPADGRRRSRSPPSRRSPSSSRAVRRPGSPRCRSCVLWLALAGRRPVGQPAAAASARRAAVGRRTRASCALIARRTWRFFETFVGPEDNCAAARQLPGGSRSRSSRTAPRRRTSASTCSSTVAARDFGWIGTLEMVERLEATLATIERLERFRGHLYNWYDTRDLDAARAAYVSTVDSGNLAGHLLALAQRLPRDDRPAAPDRGRARRDRGRARPRPRGRRGDPGRPERARR